MNAKQLDLGNQYTFNNGCIDISFYKEHNIYFICGFINHIDDTFSGIYEPFETFKEAKKYFNSLKQN